MAFFDDDACPFDWAEYNLPAELLTQSGTMLGVFATPAMAPTTEMASDFYPHHEPPAPQRPTDA